MKQLAAALLTMIALALVTAAQPPSLEPHAGAARADGRARAHAKPSSQDTPEPGCVTATPSPEPSPTPTSYRVFDALAHVAVSKPRVAPGEALRVIAHGSSPFAYRLHEGPGAVEGLRFTGTYTYTHSGRPGAEPCRVEPGGFECRDDTLFALGSVTLYADAIAEAATAGTTERQLCVEIESDPPFGSGHDSDPANNVECVTYYALGELDARSGGIRSGGSKAPPKPGNAAGLPHRSVSPPAARPLRPLQATATPSTEPEETPTGTAPPPVCATATATFTPTATPTSVRMYDLSLMAWSELPRVEAGQTLRLVVRADLDAKWRVSGSLDGEEGLRFTGAYTFTRPSAGHPRRCEVEERAFRCYLDTPGDVYFSQDEDIFLDARADPVTATRTIDFCALAEVQAPRGSGGDPDGSNNRSCARIAVRPGAIASPEPARLWLPFLGSRDAPVASWGLPRPDQRSRP